MSAAPGSSAQARAGWVFSLPALVMIGVFFLLPVAAALALSFTDFDLYALADWRNLRFVGLANYAQVLSLPLFWQALGNTMVFVVVGVPLSIGVSLAAALLLQSPLARFKPLWRTALFAPVVTTGAKKAVRNTPRRRVSGASSRSAAASDAASDSGTPSTTNTAVLPSAFQNMGVASRVW